MKRTLLIFLSVILSLSALVGCDTVTDAETSGVTEETTVEAPTEVPTEVSTEVPTEAPTEAPTEVPTEAPTEVPTEVPTDAPTETEEGTVTEDPTQYPARGALYDVSGFVSEGQLRGARFWTTLTKAPVVTLDSLPASQSINQVDYSRLLSGEYYPHGGYSSFFVNHSGVLHQAVCKLDDTHLCTVERIHRDKIGRAHV